MIAIRGAGSQIAKELVKLLPAGETHKAVSRYDAMPNDAGRYVFCGGLLVGKPIAKQALSERVDTMTVNFHDVVRECERVIGLNNHARIVVLGSESGFSGSYDGTYAQAKRELHQYVETRRLRTPYQQLVCVAPSIIEDCAMTLRRTDRKNLDRRRSEHPKGRFLSAAEVARLVYFVLYQDEGYLSNVVLRMNGGSHAYLLKAIAA